MSPSDDQIRAAIAEQASEWFIENRSGPLDRHQAARFMAWLRASPVHVEAYLRIGALAPDIRAAAKMDKTPRATLRARARAAPDDIATLDRAGSGNLPTATQPRLRRARVWSMAAGAVLVLVGAATVWLMRDGERFGFPRTYRTLHDEQRIEQLPDGSVLRLDTDSEATVRYSASERLIELKRGQALLEVAHENSRRFRVAAGDAGAVAIGTRFDVYRRSNTIEFTVVSGEIAVFRGEPRWLHAGASLPVAVQRVTAGYQLRVDAGVPAAHPVPVDLDQALGWVQHKIVFEHRPLGDVAAEFNRYGKIPVEIDDAELRALPVSGTFDAADTESFVALLQTLPGVSVERTPARIRVIRTKTTT